MRNRLAAMTLTTALLVAGSLLAGPVSAATASAGTTSAPAAAAATTAALPAAAAAPANAEGDWWCVWVETIDFGYCQSDPLPDRLPIPGTDGSTPA
ncbi:MAG TPA: hypothetical protein VFA94_05335 [Acidimicrobiales bacterium]|nr:hypothetical protein [Acidimicrobiales bacterium]